MTKDFFSVDRGMRLARGITRTVRNEDLLNNGETRRDGETGTRAEKPGQVRQVQFSSSWPDLIYPMTVTKKKFGK